MENFIFVFWYWWILAIIFLVIEMLVSGFFFLWMSASALATGILVWLIPSFTIEVQFFIFSLLSIIAIASWKIFAKKNMIASDKPLLNKRGAQYVGRVFELYEAIQNGQGKIKVDDSIWKVCGEDCGIGTKV
ncbi:MAG: NfeD family protein, partial [Methylovulum miyakonense]|uniref:NfeD family protein n=1 Tax=Methylovulum miyakonense TaxID=645578 RepID=UPI003BB61BBB